MDECKIREGERGGQNNVQLAGLVMFVEWYHETMIPFLLTSNAAIPPNFRIGAEGGQKMLLFHPS